jgi:Na+/H+ antiporter NhaD/arsenite permease-like protein
MAQIAGYAAGGCWTHIGSAQSVVAYSFIKREVDAKMTPFGWIKAMTPIILEIILLMTVVVYGEGLLLRYLPEH